MSATVNVHEAKTHFSKLLERAHRGEEIIVAKAGKPYAKLVKFEAPAPKPRQPGRLKGQFSSLSDAEWFESDFTDADWKAFEERDRKELGF